VKVHEITKISVREMQTSWLNCSPLEFSSPFHLYSSLIAVFAVSIAWLYRSWFVEEAEALSSGIARRLKFPARDGVHPKPTANWTKADSVLYRNGFVDVRNSQVWWQCFHPMGSEPRGVVVMFHGYGDHSDYLLYEQAHDMALEGDLIVISFDQAGFGRSDGLWAYIPNWAEHVEHSVEATRRIIKEVTKEQQTNLPVFAYGHSMGGGLVVTAAINHPNLFQGLVLTAPMVGVSKGLRPNAVVEFIFMLIANLFPTLPIAPVPDIGPLCFEDPKFYDYVKRTNALNYPGHLRLGTAKSLLGAQDWISSHAKRLETPFIVLHGDTDLVTSWEGSQGLFNSAASADKDIDILKGYYHVIWGAGVPSEKNEYAKNRIINWITKRCLPMKS
jgi:acylglycerol lipase